MHELTDERLAELRRIAEGTCPGGEWTAGESGQVRSEDGEQVYSGDCWCEGVSLAAEHIAAFDPPTAIALLAEVERLRAQLNDIVSVLSVALGGEW